MKMIDKIALLLALVFVGLISYRAYWNNTLEGRKANAVVDRRIGCALRALAGEACDFKTGGGGK